MNGSAIWVVWALNLLAQNFAFTFVSRARSSGSLKRHVVAAIFSNGIWILQMQIMFGSMIDYLMGKHGLLPQIGIAVYYTLFTVTGSVLAHKWALKHEKGQGKVGATKDRAEITPEEWEQVRAAAMDWMACCRGTARTLSGPVAIQRLPAQQPDWFGGGMRK